MGVLYHIIIERMKVHLEQLAAPATHKIRAVLIV